MLIEYLSCVHWMYELVGLWTLGQSTARNSSHHLWKCQFRCQPCFGYPWSPAFGPTTWIRWFHPVIISTLPGQRLTMFYYHSKIQFWTRILSILSCLIHQVTAGREWFIHTIYTLRSKENASRGKRSLEYHHAISSIADSGTQSRSRRAVPDSEAFEIGAENNLGTNIQRIALDRSNRLRVSQPWGRETYLEHPLVEGSLGKGPGSDSSLPAGMSTLLGVAGLILLVCLVVVLVVLLMRCKRKEKKYPPYSTSSCTAYSREPMRQNVDSSEV